MSIRKVDDTGGYSSGEILAEETECDGSGGVLDDALKKTSSRR